MEYTTLANGLKVVIVPDTSAPVVKVVTFLNFLLGGVVFINLADLRLNLRLEQATQTRAKLRAEHAALQSQLSSALASARIQQLASTRDGLVQPDPSTIGYINLGR